MVKVVPELDICSIFFLVVTVDFLSLLNPVETKENLKVMYVLTIIGSKGIVLVLLSEMGKRNKVVSIVRNFAEGLIVVRVYEGILIN